MKKKLLFLLGALVCTALAEARVVTGTVRDAQGEPVISASVVVKGTTTGTVTDFDGKYTLEVPDGSTLVFSYIGMKAQERAVKGGIMDVTLAEDTKLLDEVVVTGYGQTNKRDLVTSVGSVGGDQLKDQPVTSAAEALEGKLAGVQVTTSEGDPDAEVKIRVRGGSSLTQSSEPLYIVDGFPVSSISDIAPTDIASMDVLKDAAATAIYGAQGANGVIIITTKDTKIDENSKKMKIHADYSGYVGWRELANTYQMMDNQDYLRMQYEFLNLSENGNTDKLLSRFYNIYDIYDPNQGRYKYAKASSTAGTTRQEFTWPGKGLGEEGGEEMPQLQDLLNFWSDKGDVNWQNEIFGGKHLNSNHSISVNGSNKKVSFNLSYNRVDDNSIMYGSNFARNNVQGKVKWQPIKGLNLGLNVRFTNTDVLGSGTNSAEAVGSSKSDSKLRNTISFVPLYGIPVKLNTAEQETSVDDNSWNLYNPFTATDDAYKKKVENKWSINGFISYKFLKHFTLRAEAGYEGRQIDQDRYFGATNSYSKNGAGKSHTSELSNDPMGNTISSITKASRFKETNTFEYAQKWGQNRHNFSLLIGEEQTIKKNRIDYTYGFGFNPSASPQDIFKNPEWAHETIEQHYIDPNDNLLSFFTRANYTLLGRYLFTATFRADASTKFAKGNQWGYFPSGAFAWRMIDEKWMAPVQKVMSNWKWRISYGTVGNNNVALGCLNLNYLEMTTDQYMQGMNDILIDGAQYGASQLTAFNPNLKWETTITRDLGMDFGFFNERLSGTVDIYWNTTKDLILRYKLATGGYNYQFRNIGSTENKGVEFSIKGVILDKHTERVSYGLTVDANISHNLNKVVDLGGMDSYEVSAECFSSYYKSPYEFYLTPGSRIGDVYGFQTAGIYTVDDFDSYNPTAKAGKSPWQKNGSAVSTIIGEAYPGMTKLVDQNGDGKIDENDMVKLGNTMPKATGGFNLNAFVGGDKWGKVDLTANFTYSIGNDVVNMTGLDFSTVTSSTKNRNLLASCGYAQRYSLFDANGQMYGYADAKSYADENYESTINGTNYQKMAAAISAGNAGKTGANPYSTYTVLTDKYVEDASFLRLASINIGYSLSPKWIEKAHLSQARIFFSASNIFCITKYSGADPEVDTRSGLNPLAVGVDFSAFPKSRSYNFGLNLSF